MEKLISRCSYWLGIACLVIAAIWRIANVFRSLQSSATTGGFIGGTIWPSSFMHASILFLVAAIATACYSWLNSHKP